MSEWNQDNSLGKKNCENSENSGSQIKKYRRFVLDPFQIFCLENRPMLTKLNPKSKTFEITSMLSGIWRNLPEPQKQHYHMVALQLKNNKCSVSRKKRNYDMKDGNNENNDTDTKTTEKNDSDKSISMVFEKLEGDQMDRNMIEFDFVSSFDL